MTNKTYDTFNPQLLLLVKGFNRNKPEKCHELSTFEIFIKKLHCIFIFIYIFVFIKSVKQISLSVEIYLKFK